MNPPFAALDLERVWALMDEIEDTVGEDEPVDRAALEAVAAKAEAPLTHVWVAAGGSPDTYWSTEHETRIDVCVGDCQAWGALPLLEALFSERDAREAAGEKSFDVCSVGCAGVCDFKPAARSLGPAGFLLHRTLTVADVPELVKALVDG